MSGGVVPLGVLEVAGIRIGAVPEGPAMSGMAGDVSAHELRSRKAPSLSAGRPGTYL